MFLYCTYEKNQRWTLGAWRLFPRRPHVKIQSGIFLSHEPRNKWVDILHTILWPWKMEVTNEYMLLYLGKYFLKLYFKYSKTFRRNMISNILHVNDNKKALETSFQKIYICSTLSDLTSYIILFRQA